MSSAAFAGDGQIAATAGARRRWGEDRGGTVRRAGGITERRTEGGERCGFPTASRTSGTQEKDRAAVWLRRKR